MLVPKSILIRRSVDPVKFLDRAMEALVETEDGYGVMENDKNIHIDPLCILMICQDMCRYEFQRELLKVYPTSELRQNAEREILHWMIELMKVRQG